MALKGECQEEKYWPFSPGPCNPSPSFSGLYDRLAKGGRTVITGTRKKKKKEEDWKCFLSEVALVSNDWENLAISCRTRARAFSLHE